MLFISLTLTGSQTPTYRQLREFVKATSHIDDEEELKFEWDEHGQEFIGLMEAVETLAPKEV